MSVPWDVDYTNPTPDAGAQAQVGLTPTPVPPTPAPPVQTSLGSEASGPVIPPGASVSASAPAGGKYSVQSDFEDLARAAVGVAVKEALNEIKTTVPAQDSVTYIDPKDLLKASARSRALRTFLQGLGITVFWTLITAIGDFSNVDWFSRQGWITVGTLAGATVIHAATSYVARVINPPKLADLPGGG